jgi:hypothetical protein
MRAGFNQAKKKPPEVAFFPSSEGLEHEAYAHRAAGASGSEIDGVAIKSGCAEVDLLDLDLQKGVFIKQSFYTHAPAAAGDVFGHFSGY